MLGLQSSIQYVTNPAFNVLTGSSQIESQNQWTFNKGFEFVGQIKGAYRWCLLNIQQQ